MFAMQTLYSKYGGYNMSKKKKMDSSGMGLATGLSLGLIYGLLFDNLLLGLSLGLAFGTSFDRIKNNKEKK